MKEDFRNNAEFYDQIYRKRKDYPQEAKAIKNVVRRFEKKPSKTLLDIGCGTGEHLKYLSKDFTCMGIDINENMIRIAKNKVSDARFKVADMVDFSLKERFDVITCLFSAIGYARTYDNLAKALENMHKHLTSNGLVIIESWVFLKDFMKGKIAIDTYEDEKVKMARMATSNIVGPEWHVSMHYLIGTDNGIKHVKETHRMLAANYEDYVRAFKTAGFNDLQFLKEDLWDGCRGLYIGFR
jgi:SAM-dependent methyltransferase